MVALAALSLSLGLPATAGTDSRGALTPGKAKAAGLCGTHGCWPTLYVVGAHKAATSAIFNLLSEEDLVCGRSGEEGAAVKESHFFDDGHLWVSGQTAHLKKDKTLHRYLGGYDFGGYNGKEACTADAFMDATPTYFREFNGAARMESVMPLALRQTHARFLVLLREPVARDISFFNMWLREWTRKGGKGDKKHKKAAEDAEDEAEEEEAKTLTLVGLGSVDKNLCGPVSGGAFPSYADSVACEARRWQQECLAHHAAFGGQRQLDHAYRECAHGSHFGVKAVKGSRGSYTRLTDGMYAAQLQRYVNVFPRAHVLVLNFDALVTQQADYLQRAIAFFGLGTVSQVKSLPDYTVKSFARKVHKPNCRTAHVLREVFAPWNQLLYSQLHADREGKAAPTNEPAFSPFEDASCTDDDAEEPAASNVTSTALATGAAGSAASMMGFSTYKPSEVDPSPEPSPDASDEDSEDDEVVAQATAVAARKREMLADLKKVIKQAREGVTLDATMAQQLKEASKLSKDRSISLDEAAEQLIDERQITLPRAATAAPPAADASADASANAEGDATSDEDSPQEVTSATD